MTVAHDTPPAASPDSPAKPRLRGWLHLVWAPIVLVAGVVLIAVAPTGAGRVTSAIFIGSALLLFGVSATYHRGHWGKVGEGVLRRLDHSNIAIIIAGTYTPLATLLLPHSKAVLLLWIIWGGALAAILVRVLWLAAPRWSYVPIYLALGWVALWFLPDFWRAGGPAVVVWLLVGGIAYSVGAIVYGLKRPDPWPKTFGFHEIFHTLTIIGFASHYIAVWLAVTGA